jgi:hypothetical protein
LKSFNDYRSGWSKELQWQTTAVLFRIVFY